MPDPTGERLATLEAHDQTYKEQIAEIFRINRETSAIINRLTGLLEQQHSPATCSTTKRVEAMEPKVEESQRLIIGGKAIAWFFGSGMAIMTGIAGYLAWLLSKLAGK
jgi:hypothetical protein